MKLVSRRSIFNLVLFVMLVMGLPVAAATPWGWALVGLPLLVWGTAFVTLVHKSLWAAAVFWATLAVIQWQVALALFGMWILFWIVRGALLNPRPATATAKDAAATIINPATGLRMSNRAGLDASGKGYGEI